MFRIVVLLLVLIACPSITLAAPQKRPAPSKPLLEDITGAQAVVSGHPLKPGKGYLLAQSQALKVFQDTGAGQLIRIQISPFYDLPEMFFLKTVQRRVDDSPLPVPLCGIYTGVMKYKGKDDNIYTVHQFTETSCSRYRTLAKAKPATVTVAKPSAASSVSATVAPKQTSYVESLRRQYASLSFPAHIKMVIRLIRQDLEQCAQTQHCQFEGAYYAFKEAERTNASGMQPLYDQFPERNWDTFELMLAQNYLDYKKGVNTAFADKWPDLEKLAQSPNLTIAEIYSVVNTPPSIDTSRWKEAFRHEGKTTWVDTQTVTRGDLIPGLYPSGDIRGLRYKAWYVTTDMFGKRSEAQQADVNCGFREGIVPESHAEKLHNWFCNSPDARNYAANPPITPYEQAQRNNLRHL